MRTTVVEKLRARIQAYSDFAATLDAADLGARLGVNKDKTIAEHLWCIVGARESYAKALTAGKWGGFACSMTSYDQHSFVHALASSARALLASIDDVVEWTSEHDRLLADVSEHEVMHQGQIIRHMYGLDRELPKNWKWA